MDREVSRLAHLKLNGKVPRVPLEKLGTASEAALDLTLEQMTEMEHAHVCGSPDDIDLEIVGLENDPQKVADMTNIDVQEAVDIIHNMKVLLDRQVEERPDGVMASSNSYWPKDCHAPEHPGYAVYYWVDRESFPERFFRPTTRTEIQGMVDVTVWGDEESLFDRFLGKPMLDVVMWMVEQAYARHGLRLVEVTGSTRPSSADIYLTGAILSNGWFGFGQFPVGRCDHVSRGQIRKNSNYNPNLHQLFWLILHEIGHMVGLGHTRSAECNWKDIMSYCNTTPSVGFYNPSTMNVPSSLVNGRKKDRSIVTLDKLYTGVPLSPDNPTHPDDGLYLPGEVRLVKLPDGTNKFVGKLGPVNGKRYIFQRQGTSDVFRFLQESDLL